MTGLFYVYALIDPRNSEPIYIGKGTDKRMYDHWEFMLRAKDPGGNPHLRRKLTNIFVSGYSTPLYEILFRSSDERLCFWMERFWIYVIGKKNLCNMTHGGDTGPDRSGIERPQHIRDKISKTLMGHPGAMLNRKLSPEACVKIGNTHRGRKRSQQTRDRLRASHLGKVSCPIGEKHYNAKLNDDKVRAIRVSALSYSVLQKQYGVTISVIHEVKTFKTWKHVTLLDSQVLRPQLEQATPVFH
jgi:hypothetical protein